MIQLLSHARRALHATALLAALALSLHAAPGGESVAPERRESKAGGAVYVPLESWVYTALDRLAALGLVPSQISGLRPWTRAECRRQTVEAQKALDTAGEPYGPAREIVTALQRELSGDDGVVLESLYTRNGFIAGPALTDSFHFGQTWSNDVGRPFGRGWNSYQGFTVRAQTGRFFAYVQGESQHAPAAEAYPFAVRETVSRIDGIPLQPGNPVAATDRFRLLDSYVGVRLGGIEVSAGKQSLWWGPSHDAPLSFSNNAEPTKNLKASLAEPIRLPGVFSHLGEIRGEVVIGKLGGHAYTWRTWFSAQKISFKLTENLEMGFTRWSILWGVGHPMTVGSFLRNLTSTSSPNAGGVGRADPGDRKGGFDFRYRVPGLRNWLTLYADSYCDDDPSPLAAPRRAAILPGLYLTHVPGVPKLDLRVESPSTTPMSGDYGGLFIYDNISYLSGNTNYGTLLGNAVGRDGRAYRATSAYHFASRTNLEVGFSHATIGGAFLPGGGSRTDANARASILMFRNWTADIFVQRERFNIPALDSARRNVSGWAQITWTPNLPVVGGGRKTHQ